MPGASLRHAALAALAALLTPWAAAQSGDTRMRIQILPEDKESSESAQEVLDKLTAAISDGGDADSFALLRDIAPETLSAKMMRDKDHAAVDVYSESAFNAVANDDFKVTAGGTFEGRIQENADVVVGGLEVQTLRKISVSSGDNADVGIDGDIAATATGAVSLDAATVQTRIKESTGLVAGGDLSMTAGGDSSFDAASLLANIRGDIDVSGGAMSLSGTKELSVVAGDIDVKTPGSVRLAGSGGYAELDGTTDIEFDTFMWRSAATFDFFENPLPAEVTDVTEIVIRGTSGSAASVVAAARTTLTMQLGELIDGTMTWKTVWTSKVGQGTYSLDGLVVNLDRLYSVSAMRLSSDAGDGKTFTGWSEIQILFGREIASGAVKVASAANLEATAAEGVLLNAQTVQLNAASELDISASDSARLLTKDVSVQASNSLEASTGSLDLVVTESINAFSGGDVSGSFGAVTAESRGDVSLAAAGDVSVAGQSADISLSGPLTADADSVQLHTESLTTNTAHLSATVADGVSLHTTDASLSASGKLSAYMASGDIVSEGSLQMRSAGELSMRTQGTIQLESVDTTRLRSKTLTTTTGNLEVHAGGGDEGKTMSVELDCADCVDNEEQARIQMAEMLGIPMDRLVVSQVNDDDSAGGSGRRRMQEEEEAPPPARRKSNKPELALWSVDELEKWLARVLGLRNLAEKVVADGVDGAMAAEMDKADWVELGCTATESTRIVKALKKFAGPKASRSR